MQNLLFPEREYDWIEEEFEGKIEHRESAERDLSLVGKAQRGESMEAEKGTINKSMTRGQKKAQMSLHRKPNSPPAPGLSLAA
jgi:hypothetical protein